MREGENTTKARVQQHTGPAVRVIENFLFPHRGGPMHTEYRKGDVVFGAEAEEILAAHRPEVVPLGEEQTQRCPACAAVVSRREGL